MSYYNFSCVYTDTCMYTNMVLPFSYIQNIVYCIVYCFSIHFLHFTCKLLNVGGYRSYDLIPWNTKLCILPSMYHCSVPWQTFILPWKGTTSIKPLLLWQIYCGLSLLYLFICFCLPFNLKFWEKREWFIYIYILVSTMGPCLRKFIQYLLHDCI